MDTLLSLNRVGVQVIAMLATFVPCLTLGAERHPRHKDADIKAHILMRLGPCLFTLMSTYGFAPITGSDVAMDLDHMAAQIVSGIGFLGAGVIFVNNDTARGLTTATTVWLDIAAGMAYGAGIIPLTVMAVALDCIVVLSLGSLASRLQRHHGEVTVRIDYEISSAAMPEILQVATASSFTATLKEIEVTRGEYGRTMNAVVRLHGQRPAINLIEALSELDGVDDIKCLEGGQLD